MYVMGELPLSRGGDVAKNSTFFVQQKNLYFPCYMSPTEAYSPPNYPV
jgi:hypothetical protein